MPIAQATVAAVNNNVTPDAGPSATMSAPIVQSQRAALALAGGTLYVAFGAYYDGGIGWMVAVNVAAKQVVHSFSGARTNPAPTPSDPSNAASGGMWGAGGPAIASDGRLFVTTGNSPGTSTTTPGVWGNSVLAWNPDLTLSATYSPFNYCLMDGGTPTSRGARRSCSTLTRRSPRPRTSRASEANKGWSISSIAITSVARSSRARAAI